MTAPSGLEIVSRAEALARISESPDGLTRRYLTKEHRRANALVSEWMSEAGMAVHEDAVGNVVGRYEGVSDGLPAVMIGSHLDTVVMAGKYDGMLGVLAGIACVEALNNRGVRLPHAVEVVGFADEEGVRFQSTYLGSRAVAGTFDPDLLERRDADGISVADAMTAFGLDPLRVGGASRRPEDILAYVELHIEQGPVLEEHNLPVAVVTSIAGAYRFAVTITGEAGHAGTVPMDLRRDALMAASQCALVVEKVARKLPDVVGTVGMFEVSPGASNVIPGQVLFAVDLRAAEDHRRMEAFREIDAHWQEIAAARRVDLRVDLVHEQASVVCADHIRRQIADAIERSGSPVVTLASGAGHDGAAMSAIADVGMIFVRCAGGISHNPNENITPADAEAGARVLLDVIENFIPKT